VVNWKHRTSTATALLARNMPLVISILSLGVAALSLYFSISTQQLDKMYKEVSILPRLVIHINLDDFSISLQNLGLGPALIERVRFGIAGKCYDSMDADRYEKMLHEFTDSVLIYGVYKDTIPHRTKDNKPLVLPVFGRSFGGGTTIRPGDSFRYIYVDPQAIKDILAFERVDVVAIKQQFSDAVAKVPLSILYCSATEVFCDVAEMKNDMCDLRTHPESP
jgi:hypothetical protein